MRSSPLSLQFTCPAKAIKMAFIFHMISLIMFELFLDLMAHDFIHYGVLGILFLEVFILFLPQQVSVSIHHKLRVFVNDLNLPDPVFDGVDGTWSFSCS